MVLLSASLGGRLEAQGEKLERVFMIAPAVMRLRDEDALPHNCPLTVIQPETDEVIDPQLVYNWSNDLSRPMSC